MASDLVAALDLTLQAALVLAAGLTLLVGSFFLTVGTIGLLRLPSVYNRLHATSKATALGAGMIALAGFIWFWPAGDSLLGLVTVVFLFLTAPTGAHRISRAAQRMGVPFVDGVAWPLDEETDPPEPADD